MLRLALLVREKDARLPELAVLPVRPSLTALLLRFGWLHASGGLAVSPPRPHHAQAARTGTCREVVSRVRSALQREGLAVSARGGLPMPRPERLAAEVEAGCRAAEAR